MDKTGYITAHAFADLLGDDHRSTFAIIASSGASGRAQYWPQLKGGQSTAAPAFRRFLETGFSIDSHPTIAIVGLALGSWIGGDMVSASLKRVAAESVYPFAVFVPGSRHEEILGFLQDAAPMLGEHGRFLLFVCPSAIGHLSLLAESVGRSLPHARMRYAVLGEPFPEALRVALRAAAGLPMHESPILSIYGSADTGVLGAESQASALIRTILHGHPETCERLGLTRTPPHLFHASEADVYLETVDEELCVTRWQGVPLVRYNLHDRATLLSWRGLCDALANDHEIPAALRAMIAACPVDLPDIIAVFGRADRCLILCGTNISEAMLDAAVAGAGLTDTLTGLYRASIVFEEGRQRLAIDLETREGVSGESTLEDLAYAGLIRSLGAAQPEFADDWGNVYRKWDNDPSKRVLRIRFVPWPALSNRPDGQIKNRGIVE